MLGHSPVIYAMLIISYISFISLYNDPHGGVCKCYQLLERQTAALRRLHMFSAWPSWWLAAGTHTQLPLYRAPLQTGILRHLTCLPVPRAILLELIFLGPTAKIQRQLVWKGLTDGHSSQAFRCCWFKQSMCFNRVCNLIHTPGGFQGGSLDV